MTLRYRYLLASQLPAHLAIQPRVLALRCVGKLLDQLDRLLVVLVQLVDAAGDIFQPVKQHLFGDFFVIEENDFLDGANSAFQVLADGDDLANHDWRTRQRLQNPKLSALDALGDFDFAFTRKQRNRSHLAQIHADRIVGLLHRARREVQFHVLAGFDFTVELLVGFGPFEHINALRTDGGNQVIEIVG